MCQAAGVYLFEWSQIAITRSARVLQERKITFSFFHFCNKAVELRLTESVLYMYTSRL